jgi:DNA-binding beta-propeller fold protein YncE
VVIDPRTGKIVRTLAAGPGPIVVLPVGGRVWVSHTAGNAVWRMGS